MKKTVKGFLGFALALIIVVSISITASAQEECIHPEIIGGICSTCNTAITETELDHEHLHEGDPTCQGHWCDICLDYYGESSADGHLFENYVHSLSATCDADAQEVAQCAYCDEVDVRAVPDTAISHDWAEATCDTPMTCLECGEIQGEALGHVWPDEDPDAKSEDILCLTCGESHADVASIIPPTITGQNGFVAAVVLVVQFVMKFILRCFLIPV